MLIHATYTEGNMIQNSSFLIANYSAHQFQVFGRGVSVSFTIKLILAKKKLSAALCSC